MKTIRSLFLQSTSSAGEETSKQSPVRTHQPSITSQGEQSTSSISFSRTGAGLMSLGQPAPATQASQESQSVKKTALVSGVTESPASDVQSSSEKSPVVVQKKPVRSVSGVAAKTARSLILANTPVTKHTEVGTDTQSMQQMPTTEGQSSLASRDEESMSSTSQLLSLAPYKRDQSSTDTTSQVPLLKKWRRTLPQVDHSWVSSALFVWDSQGDARMDLSRISGLWLYPPQAPLIPQSVPNLHNFFGHRVFIWMPIKLWSLRVACPHQDCRHLELSHAGVYQVVRQVLDVSNFYNLVPETLWCKKCKRKMVSWSHSILSQLNIGHRSHFPCLLTTMKACDTKVAILMRQRGLGNSASQIQKKLKEQHSTEWYQKTIQYLSACKSVASAASSGLIVPQRFQEPPAMAPIPQYRWLMQVYVQDVLQRHSEMKANITSVFGQILKVDSTKKVTKKLAGPSAGTAEWATNVGSEYRQVLISVLTAGEGRFGLHRMAKGSDEAVCRCRTAISRSAVCGL
ncbi:uncharacterized protein LOC123560231 [Mercenaria mercenaria]|uniref:uncharacterized protein LOC123560231 n=1 Tax=Mercenaria mercenaria TaxID=6596 RepID=UPI00234E3D87|nr:uncharacterized protein LOC123560231 [Mercenaria mercenaria]